MSTPCSLLRSASHNVPKNPAITMSIYPQRTARSPANVPSRCLATVNPGPKGLADVWFTGSAPLRSIPFEDIFEPRKPDERTVKLGKSKQPLVPSSIIPTNKQCSPSYSPRAPANSPTVSPPARDPLSANHAPPVPFHASTPTTSYRKGRLLCCLMDLPNRMGTCASRWQCQARDFVRTNGQTLRPLKI